MMGAERRTLSMTEEEKKLTAYHEGGHALVQLTVPGAMPIHKATIIRAVARWAWCRACRSGIRCLRPMSS